MISTGTSQLSALSRDSSQTTARVEQNPSRRGPSLAVDDVAYAAPSSKAGGDGGEPVPEASAWSHVVLWVGAGPLPYGRGSDKASAIRMSSQPAAARHFYE